MYARCPPGSSDASRVRAVPRSPGPTLARAIGNRAMTRLLARDLKGSYSGWDGTFTINMTRQAKEDTHGLWGTIAFLANTYTRDSEQIRLIQAVHIEDIDSGQDLVWRGKEQARNAMRTTGDASRGIEPGWFVDIHTAGLRSREQASDPAVSPYYQDSAPGDTIGHDGAKRGRAVTEAKLKDFPKTDRNLRYSFETVAVGVDNRTVYGALRWGFTVDEGVVSDEWARNGGSMSATVHEALRLFDEYYANPGASSAPQAEEEFPVGAGTGSKTGW